MLSRRNLLGSALAAPFVVNARSLLGAEVEQMHVPERWGHSNVIADRLMFKLSADSSDVVRVLRKYDVQLRNYWSFINSWCVGLPKDNSEALALDLERLGLVSVVEPDQHPLMPPIVPNDPQYGATGGTDNWLNLINAPAAWDLGIRVGLAPNVYPVYDINTGCDTFPVTNPDLSTATVLSGRNVVNNNNDTSEQYTAPTGGTPHGTYTGGTSVASLTNNSTLTSSVGWSGKLVPVVPWNAGVSGGVSAYVSAVQWVINNGTPGSVVSIPITFGVGAPTFVTACQALDPAGYLLTGSAGDLNAATCAPGTCDATNCIGAVSITSISSPLNKSDFSSYGPAANGVGAGASIAFPGGSQSPFEGTAMLCPTAFNAAGFTTTSAGATSIGAPGLAAALQFLRAVRPGLSVADFKSILLNPANGNVCTGFGSFTYYCLDLYKCAVAALAATPTSYSGRGLLGRR